MKHFLLMALLALVLTVNGGVVIQNARIQNATTVGSGSVASCALWSSPVLQQQTTDDDLFNGSAAQIVSQSIKVTASGNVCKVRLKVYTSSGNAQVKVQLRTAENGGGSQIGSDSSTVTVDNTQTVRDWDFASPITISADFVINVVGLDNAFNVRIHSATPYLDSAYHGWQGASSFGTYDLYFEVWVQ